MLINLLRMVKSASVLKSAALVESDETPPIMLCPILHLMGLDHTRLTYRYAGRDFRLTDVAGQVIQAVLT